MADMAKAPDPKKDEPARPDVDLTPHPLVAKLIGGAANPSPDPLKLEGYVGPSSRDGFVRVYLDLTFKAYFEIPKNGIVHADRADPANESKPTTILIDPATKLDLIHNLEASYLKGKIATGLSIKNLTNTCIDITVPITIHGSVTKLPCAVHLLEALVAASLLELCAK
jgi:hypothetical protein